MVAVGFTNLSNIQKAGYFGLIFYGAAIPIVKVSMCVSYQRIFYYNKTIRQLLHGLMAVLMLVEAGPDTSFIYFQF